MRTKKDLIEYSNSIIKNSDIEKEYGIVEDGNISCLKILYILNKCGFVIPFHPYECIHDLSSIDGFIEFAKSDKKIELYNDIVAIPGDIGIIGNNIFIANDEIKVDYSIRIPDYYLYTNVRINSKKKSYHSHYMTGEDIDMLKDSKYESIKKKNICDNHEDGA